MHRLHGGVMLTWATKCACTIFCSNFGGWDFCRPMLLRSRKCVKPLSADDGLFASVLHNGNHVLAQLLPPIKETPYQLRPRAHNRSLPIADTLLRKNFIERMLYKDSY